MKSHVFSYKNVHIFCQNITYLLIIYTYKCDVVEMIFCT